jgi:hypothetical protein
MTQQSDKRAEKLIKQHVRAANDPVRDCRDAPASDPQQSVEHPAVEHPEPRKLADHKLRRSHL